MKIKTARTIAPIMIAGSVPTSTISSPQYEIHLDSKYQVLFIRDTKGNIRAIPLTNISSTEPLDTPPCFKE